MRRAALLSAAVLAGCGGGGEAPRSAPPKRDTVTQRERTELKRARERLRKSSLPKDMQRELEEAQRLLDEAN